MLSTQTFFQMGKHEMNIVHILLTLPLCYVFCARYYEILQIGADASNV